jgi:hypothetical protein
LEAGRSDATFVEKDLASVTRDLCGLFRSAVESAGLRFAVNADLLERHRALYHGVRWTPAGGGRDRRAPVSSE